MGGVVMLSLYWSNFRPFPCSGYLEAFNTSTVAFTTDQPGCGNTAPSKFSVISAWAYPHREITPKSKVSKFFYHLCLRFSDRQKQTKFCLRNKKIKNIHEFIKKR